MIVNLKAWAQCIIQEYNFFLPYWPLKCNVVTISEIVELLNGSVAPINVRVKMIENWEFLV